ncbi:MAG: hypothetical protein FWC01_06805 [Treponema sp.]|nr:hypothetical protein [Treponema sp.]MCL2237558.1 hypothetical protein [Treponema sp.]
MKKRFLFLLIIASILVPAAAQDNGGSMIVNFNAGNVGFGLNLPVNNKYDFEGHFSLINIGFENKTTNLGVSFCPFLLTSWMSFESTYYEDYYYNEGGYYEDEIVSYGGIFLVNAMVYWNFFNYTFGGGSNFFVGPFASINYLLLEEDKFNTDNFIFTLGIQLGLRASFGRFQYNLFSFEIGYRNINGTHNYFIGGKLDIVTLAIASALTAPLYYW